MILKDIITILSILIYSIMLKIYYFDHINKDTDFALLTQVILLATSTQEPVSNFTITWEPEDASTGIVHNSVSFTPALSYGPINTTNSSVSVSLQLDLLYNITITQNICSPERTSSFDLGNHLKYCDEIHFK